MNQNSIITIKEWLEVYNKIEEKSINLDKNHPVNFHDLCELTNQLWILVEEAAKIFEKQNNDE